MTSPRSKKIEELEARLVKLRSEQRAAEARVRSQRVRTERATENRRKILMGAFLLQALGGASEVRALAVRGHSFAAWLTRDDDRALFGLPVLPDSPVLPTTTDSRDPSHRGSAPQ